ARGRAGRACRGRRRPSSALAGRIEGHAGAQDPPVDGGGRAPTARCRPGRLEAELAARREPEEPQLARSTTGGVEAHLALHDLRLALGSEARACAQAPDVYRACLRDVDGAHALARGTAAEVDILAVHEVAGVEAAQMPAD